MREQATAPDSATGLRAAGFLLTVAGAALAAAGALLPWLETGLEGSTVNVISPTYLGIDLAEGTTALVLAVVGLLFVVVARVGSTGSRPWAAAVVLVSGLAIIIAVVGTALTGPDRLESEAIEQMRVVFGGQVDGETLSAMERLIEVRLRPGVWLSAAGGLGVVVGGAMTLVWTRRRTMRREVDPTPVT